MTIQDKQFEVLLDASEIQRRIEELGKQISNDYATNPPLFIGVLNGVFMFAAELFKNLTIQAEISFVKISSYSNTTSTGEVKQLLGLNEPIFKRDIIILEDIVDSGKTMIKLVEMIKDLGPKSLQIASLLFKPDALNHNIDVKYVGFEIPDKFVVGYGLDYNGIGRHYKDIYQIIK